MGKQIEKLKEGGSVDKNWQTINELIDAVNALLAAEVSPQTAGKFVYADGNMKLVFNTKKCGS